MTVIAILIVTNANMLYGYAPTPKMKKYYSDIEATVTTKGNNGDADYQAIAGIMYYKGLFSKPDKKEAFKWFEKACNDNNPVALFYLGTMYYDGEGVEKDYKKAYSLLKKAVDLEYYPAFVHLGIMYENGQGIDKDEKEASKLYQTAALHGEDAAIFNQAMMYERHKDYKKAFQLFSSIKHKNINALLGIGRLYEKGNGVEKNYSLALKYYEQTAIIDPGIADIINNDITKELKRKTKVINTFLEIIQNMYRNWLTYISLFLCIIFYYMSKKERLPYVNICLDTVIDNLGKNDTPIKVLYNDDVISTLTKAEFTFWNAGRETIRKEDIAEADPLRIEFKNGKILNVILKKSNNYNNATFIVNETKDTVFLSFDYLDRNEGLVLDILTDGIIEIEILGKIKGYGEPKYKRIVNPQDLKWIIFNNFVGPIILLSMVGYFAFSIDFFNSTFTFIFASASVVFSIFAIFNGIKNLMNLLPKSLLTK